MLLQSFRVFAKSNRLALCYRDRGRVLAGADDGAHGGPVPAGRRPASSPGAPHALADDGAGVREAGFLKPLQAPLRGRGACVGVTFAGPRQCAWVWVS